MLRILLRLGLVCWFVWFHVFCQYHDLCVMSQNSEGAIAMLVSMLSSFMPVQEMVLTIIFDHNQLINWLVYNY